MCRTTFMPSGIRLQQLIQNQYKEILAREKNNDKFIHLYDIGAYWVAFERSACRLSGLFSKSELTLFRVRIVWNMWWWFLFLPMRRRAVWVSTSFCTMEFTGKCGRSMFCRWGIIVIGMRWLWGLFCCKEKYADFVDQVSGVTLLTKISYFFQWNMVIRHAL